jgi:hypothetical protein
VNDQNDIQRALGTDGPAVDVDGALARFRARVAREQVLPRVVPASRRLAPRWVQALAAAAAITLVVSGLALTGAAESLLGIFEPKQVVGVPVTQGDLSALGQSCGQLRLAECLGAYGTFTWTTPPQPREATTLAQASATAGFAAMSPGSLPQAVTGTPRFAVVNRSVATFTFSADATRQSAARISRTAPPLPANIDGSRVVVAGGPAVVQVWGASTSAPTTTTTPLSELPTLVIGQSKSPTVSSDGVGVDELRAYLLQQPGISPQLAAAIRAIGDPATTLPVPVPTDLATSHPVKVQGADGLFIGDNTGIASAIIWQKDGMMFEVIGQLTERQALDVANSMH